MILAQMVDRYRRGAKPAIVLPNSNVEVNWFTLSHMTLELVVYLCICLYDIWVYNRGKACDII